MILGIEVYLSTIFYPETDRLSEIANQEIEKHLCIFVHYWQNDQSKKLAMAKFAANNNKSASTKQFLFLASKDLHPCMSFNIVDFFNPDTCKWIYKQKT